MAEYLDKKSKRDTKKYHRVLGTFLCILFAGVFYKPSAAQFNPHSQLVSISSSGQAGNRAASQTSISANGRFVAFISEANNLVPDDSNNSADVFVHDRLHGTTERVSISSTGMQANAEISFARISHDGRFVIFESSASNLATIDNEGFSYIFQHDRLTGITEQLSTPQQGSVHTPSTASDGRYSAFHNSTEIFIHDALTRFSYSIKAMGAPAPSSDHTALLSTDGRSLLYANHEGNLSLYNRVFNTAETIHLPLPSSAFSFSDSAPKIVFMLEISADNYGIFSYQLKNQHQEEIISFSFLSNSGSPTLELSGDGNYLVVLQSGENEQILLRGYNLTTGLTQILATNILAKHFSASRDGNSIAYAQYLDEIAQIFVHDQVITPPSFVFSGRITDKTGLPLALVTLESSHGHKVKTDRQGYFWIGEINPGAIILTPSKEGYTFEPPNVSIDASSDTTNINFTVSHDQSLSEAELDIGMPYDFERGCSTPWQGCGGDFHGFSAGYCTDLILDSYTWGVDFNIQTALVRDYQAHPEHFYRWRNARNAHDMWRYFAYSGQILSHTAGYLPGDIVFFDWSGDGEIDHVNIVSEVNNRNQPVYVYDATGIIESNPGGLANELPWEAFHDSTERGHARWNGIYGAANTRLPNGDFLQISAASADIQLTIIDSQGNKLSQSERDIPNGSFFNLGWEQTANINSSPHNRAYYTIQVSAAGDGDIKYSLIMHTIQAGLITERIERSSTLKSGHTNTIYLRINHNAIGDLDLKIVRGIRKVRDDWQH